MSAVEQNESLYREKRQNPPLIVLEPLVVGEFPWASRVVRPTDIWEGEGVQYVRADLVESVVDHLEELNRGFPRPEEFHDSLGLAINILRAFVR